MNMLGYFYNSHTNIISRIMVPFYQYLHQECQVYLMLLFCCNFARCVMHQILLQNCNYTECFNRDHERRKGVHKSSCSDSTGNLGYSQLWSLTFSFPSLCPIMASVTQLISNMIMRRQFWMFALRVIGFLSGLPEGRGFSSNKLN